MPFVVGGAHAFMLRVSSYVGLAPLRFEQHGNGYIVAVSSTMCIYSYTLITVLVIFTIAGLAAEIYVGVDLSVRMTSRMSQFVCSCDILVVAATAGVGVYGAPRRMKNMLKYMGSVASVDTSIGAHYSADTERKLSAFLLLVLVAFAALIIGDFSFYVLQAQDVDRQWDILTNYSAFYLLWFVLAVLELQFAFTAFSLHARFQAVNDALALTASQVSAAVETSKGSLSLNVFAMQVAVEPHRRGEDVSLSVDFKPAPKNAVIVQNTANGMPKLTVPPCEAISRLSQLRNSLCGVVRGVCCSYGVPLVVIIVSTLLHLIVTPYFLVVEIISSTVRRLHFLMLLFLWCVTHVLRIFLVVEPCHHTIYEGQRTEQLVCSMLSEAPLCSTLSARLQQFCRQLTLQSVSYTPMGMCTLDRPLVANILGAVTTYLVILIQFQRNNDCSD